MDNNLVKGVFVENPREGAPDFVKGRISINAKFLEWYNANKNEAGYVNLDLLESQKGQLYVKLNDWKPKSEEREAAAETEAETEAAAGSGTGGDSEDDLPF